MINTAKEWGAPLTDLFPRTVYTEEMKLPNAIKAAGNDIKDVKAIIMGHLHLDHAGAAGTLVRENPELTVWVSEVGAPHLLDPSRLERSARRLYGETFDGLWGELAPVPEANLRTVGARARDVRRIFATEGLALALGGWLLVRMAELEMPERFSARTSTDAGR